MSGRVSRIIRRTMLLHLSASAPVLVACGGQTRATAPPTDSGTTDSGTTSDAASPGDSGACNEAVDGGPPCTVISCVAPVFNSYRAGCATGQYGIYGAAEQCLGDGGADDAGNVFPTAATCRATCPPFAEDGGAALPIYGCYLVGQNLTCEYGGTLCFVTGRRPRGLRRRSPDRAADPVARYLAQMAHLEAASVPAFSRVARELAEHGAPRSLRRAAVRAMRDEVRHARVVTVLAERAGAGVRRPRVREGRPRSLEAMAIENAVEGCVRETFGAAVAVAQSLTASDPRVRAAMRRIAIDETRHAELSWRVARWLDVRLDRAARDRVARARRRAARSLMESVRSSVHPALVDRLGIPPAPVAIAVARDMARALWDA